jgi:hypothetical protein
VEDGRIARMTPIDLDNSDAASWTIDARGRGFAPPRSTTKSPHVVAQKSMVHSRKRVH